jgi:glycosyltransferase involved in cell wall biosynthesis
MAGRKLKIAYLCDRSPEEGWSYSGGNTRIYDSLSKHVDEVVVLENRWGRADWVRRALNAGPEAINLRAGWRLRLLLSKIIARSVQEQLSGQDFDVLFCPYSLHALGNLLPQPNLLTVFTSDATQTVYRQSEIGAFYGSYWSVSRILDPLIFEAERKILTSTDVILWPSDWLKERADAMYGLGETQSLHVPWGANIETPDRESLVLSQSLKGQIRLLLIGRDWFAKGGPLVVEVLDHLLSVGIDAHLTVVGCVPPDEYRREQMTVHAYLRKDDPAEREIFESLLRNAHFFIMPSFESYGFAFAEASAYGLPSLALRIGGVPIQDGVNGHALPRTATKEDFAGKILFYRQNEESYSKLRASSRQLFEGQLNWDAWGRKVSELVAERLNAKRTRAA